MGWFTSKKELKKIIAELEYQIRDLNTYIDNLQGDLNTVSEAFDTHKNMFPLNLGETVYDVQLRSSKGRFTKTKASLEHSLINEVIVDKKNYFNLVDRYNSSDVFFTRSASEKHLKDVCVE